MSLHLFHGVLCHTVCLCPSRVPLYANVHRSESEMVSPGAQYVVHIPDHHQRKIKLSWFNFSLVFLFKKQILFHLEMGLLWLKWLMSPTPRCTLRTTTAGRVRFRWASYVVHRILPHATAWLLRKKPIFGQKVILARAPPFLQKHNNTMITTVFLLLLTPMYKF